MDRHEHPLSTACNPQSVLDTLNQRASVFRGACCERPRPIRLSGCSCPSFEFRPLILSGLPEGRRTIASQVGSGLLVAVLVVRDLVPRLEPHMVDLTMADRFALGSMVNGRAVERLLELAA